MFALPAAREGQEMHEGVPMVKPVTDREEDIIHALLDALYHPGALSVPCWHPDAPLVLNPAMHMRLTTKYQVASEGAHHCAGLRPSRSGCVSPPGSLPSRSGSRKTRPSRSDSFWRRRPRACGRRALRA
ncbi:hypothetical protein PsYK624_114810 [Phanerochaete sordida]|uniref:Uncharacterized protein n=1 Tax=Phanerochaete sordida TaxID=48140 RepID=A0A9P3GFY8_9APHY|nr:hypothetical protein PsYK624_114810 [Phanerochaete sordida]